MCPNGRESTVLMHWLGLIIYNLCQRGAAVKKILIVEDDISIQVLLYDFIKAVGYDVAIAADGARALT